ncbi:MAG: hypothetical protein MJ239_03410 [Bacilli bacterium]|nr:hypothetical protein [Bacilli bacterium]
MKAKIKSLVFVLGLAAPFLLNGCGGTSHTHKYDVEHPIWNWAEDHKSASLSFKCEGCEEFSAPVVDNDIEVVDNNPTCTESAIDYYTAEAVFEGVSYSDTVTVEEPPLGHDFTSIEVSGVQESGYNALSAVTGLSVNKVCSRGDKLAANASEIEIVYSHGDGMLHGDDTSIEVKIKGTALSKVVPVTVHKIRVIAPTPDQTEFVYNQNEQVYQIEENEYYQVTGNKKTDAGTTKVLVSLKSKIDTEWSDGTTDDKSFDFTIAKATPVITGLSEAYSIDCHGTLDLSEVKASIGDLSIKAIDRDGNEADLSSITGGEYTLVAAVEETSNYYGATQSAVLTVNHKFTSAIVPDPKGSSSKIGNKTLVCSECEEGEAVPMENGDLNADWGYGFGVNGESVGTSGLAGEFPEYASSTRSAYRDWTINNTTSTIRLPRTDFTVFSNACYVFHTNSTTSQFFGIGLNSADDTIAFANHGNALRFALKFAYEEESEILCATLNSSIGLSRTITINDKDVIEGNTSFEYYVHGGAWRQLVLDNVDLNHECGETIDLPNSESLGIVEACASCYEPEPIKEGGLVYDTKTFATNKLGISINNGMTNGIDNNEDVGAIKLGGDQGAVTEAEITLPKANFNILDNVVITFSNNGGTSFIGFDSDNVVGTTANTRSENKSTIKMEKVDGGVKVTIVDAKGSVNKTYSEQEIIDGMTPVKLYVKLTAWNYIAISKVAVNTL